jgi:hypothetical protein
MAACAAPAHGQTSAHAPAAPAAAAATDTPVVLAQAKTALERAHFDEAERLLSELLARDSLKARERNHALELLAILQIAERKESRARETLLALLRRDPDHHRYVLDPGPAVDAAFARIKQNPPAPLQVPLQFSLHADDSLRPVLRLELGEGRDAVDSVHVFVGAQADAHQHAHEPGSHLESEVEGDGPLQLLLPAAARDSHELALYLEARAPSGAVLGRVGDAGAAVHVPLPHVDPPLATCTVAREPLRRKWWLWTTVGLVVSGIVIGSALAVH